MAGDAFGRRLLVALADASPAFRAHPDSAMRGFGRRLLVALADASPAFRSIRTEELHQRSSRPRAITVRNPESMSAIAKSLETLEVRFSELERRENRLIAVAEAMASREQTAEASKENLIRALYELMAQIRAQEQRRDDQLIAVAEAMASHEQAAEASNENLLTMLSQLVSALQERIGAWSAGTMPVGRTSDAIAVEERIVAETERLLGPKHRDTLIARVNLTTSYRSEGRIGEAIAMGEQVAADMERLLGPEHPDTLAAWASLATSYRSAGRAGEAIEIGEQVAADMERLLGPEHPDTLAAWANLAMAKTEEKSQRIEPPER